MRRRRTRLALLTGAVGALLITWSASAGASSVSGGDPAPAATPPAVDPVQRVASARTCTMYGSANGFGMVCSDGSGGTGLGSLLALLGGRPLPGCWDDPAPDGFSPPQPQSGPGGWWLQTCLHGLDPVTLTRTGPLSLDFAFAYLPPGGQVQLTAGQRSVIDYFYGQGQIPFPVLATSPTSSPRVNEPVSFRVLDTSTPHVNTGGVEMYAQVVGLQIDPGDGTDPIYCTGPGRDLTADQLADNTLVAAPDVCAHTYQRSSYRAGQVGDIADRYPVTATAYWQIRYLDDTGEHVLGTYTKQALNALRVTEIQTLIVT